MHESLEDKISSNDNIVDMLRNTPISYYKFPYPEEHTNWRDEQVAWKKTVALFDQSGHMSDVYFEGPDVHKLISDTGINSFAKFGKGKAKQFVAVTEEGYVIADAILFGLDDDKVSLVGTPAAGNWVQFQAETGGYDVKVTRDDASPFNPNPRLTYRYQLNGPATQKVIEQAQGSPVDRIKFFNIGQFTIEGCTVNALNHTMSGVPGQELTGLELWGPREDADKVLDALLRAGQQFGLVRGGAQSYVTAALESGWLPLPTPAIYTGEQLKPYREWLSAQGFEASMSIGGSFVSRNIEDYYLTPWDLGYGHLVKFDHDFIGREALERKANEPHMRKVWLTWSNEDAAAVFASSLLDGDQRAKWMNFPNATYAISMYDDLSLDGRHVGFCHWTGYTVNIGAVSGIGMVNEADAVDGAELTLTWGEPDGGSAKPFVERHVQKQVRVTVSTTPLGQ
jgi:vanillate/3-O-methylgallate O-demethylase